MKVLRYLRLPLILAVFTVAAYSNSLRSPFLQDSISKVKYNKDIRSLANIKDRLVFRYSGSDSGFESNDPSRPLVYLSFMLNYHFGGLDTFGYHIVNLALHILNVILIFFLIGRMAEYVYGKKNNIFGFFVALLFALHPLNVNVASYIFSRSVAMSVFFNLSALLLMLEVFSGRKYLYIPAVICYIMALFSRQDAVVFAFIILVFDYIFVSDMHVERLLERKKYHITLWAVFAGYLLFRYFYFGAIGDIEAKSTYPVWAYRLIQPYVIWRYIKFAIIPTGLSISHIVAQPGSVLDPRVIGAVFLTAVSIFGILKYFAGKRESFKIAVFSIIWFLVLLAPTSSVFPTTVAMEEKRAYLPAAVLYMGMVLLYFRLYSIDLKKDIRFGNVLLPACIIFMHAAILGSITVNMNKLYNDPEAVLQDAVKKYPSNLMGTLALGEMYFNRGDFKKALDHYSRAVSIEPSHVRARFNLATLYEKLGDVERARRQYSEIIRIQPDYADAYVNLGNIMYVSGNYDEALVNYEKAVNIREDHQKALNNMGLVLARKGDDEGALIYYRKVLAINPDNADACFNIAALYDRRKEGGEAAEMYLRCIELDPGQGDVHIRLGDLYFRMNDPAAARDQYNEALRIDPADPIAQKRLREFSED